VYACGSFTIVAQRKLSYVASADRYAGTARDRNHFAVNTPRDRIRSFPPLFLLGRFSQGPQHLKSRESPEGQSLAEEPVENLNFAWVLRQEAYRLCFRIVSEV